MDQACPRRSQADNKRPSYQANNKRPSFQANNKRPRSQADNKRPSCQANNKRPSFQANSTPNKEAHEPMDDETNSTNQWTNDEAYQYEEAYDKANSSDDRQTHNEADDHETNASARVYTTTNDETHPKADQCQ
jgi:hypothetical protein